MGTGTISLFVCAVFKVALLFGTCWSQQSTTTTTQDPEWQRRNCKPDEFKCWNGYNACLPGSQVCDGYQDCMDGSDEYPLECERIASSTTSSTPEGFSYIQWWYILVPVTLVLVVTVTLCRYSHAKRRMARASRRFPNLSLEPPHTIHAISGSVRHADYPRAENIEINMPAMMLPPPYDDAIKQTPNSFCYGGQLPSYESAMAELKVVPYYPYGPQMGHHDDAPVPAYSVSDPSHHSPSNQMAEVNERRVSSSHEAHDNAPSSVHSASRQSDFSSSNQTEEVSERRENSTPEVHDDASISAISASGQSDSPRRNQTTDVHQQSGSTVPQVHDSAPIPAYRTSSRSDYSYVNPAVESDEQTELSTPERLRNNNR